MNQKDDQMIRLTYDMILITILNDDINDIGKWNQALAQKIRSAFENGSSLSAVTTKLRSLDKKKKKYKVEGKIRQAYLNEFGQLKNKDSVLRNEPLRNIE